MRAMKSTKPAWLAGFLAFSGGGWQFYNWILYRGKDRRREFRRQSFEEVGNLYGISATDMAYLQDVRKAAVVQFHDNRYYYCIDGEKTIEIGMLRKD